MPGTRVPGEVEQADESSNQGLAGEPPPCPTALPGVAGLKGAVVIPLTVDGRIDSWKAIAAHLKRGVTTVQRWEREERLPVHRLPHTRGDSVFAWRAELDEWWRLRSEHPETRSRPRPEPYRLLVLPFDNLTGDPSQDAFASELTDELIGHLARAMPTHLVVIARRTAEVCKRSGNTVRAMAEELNLDYVVEGNLRHRGEGLRLNLQVVAAPSETQVWGARAALPAASAAELPSELATALVACVATRWTRPTSPSCGRARGTAPLPRRE